VLYGNADFEASLFTAVEHISSTVYKKRIKHTIIEIGTWRMPRI
jgi:hypothetical protein